MPFDQFWTSDVIAETAHLSLAETGAYLKLRLACHKASTRGLVNVTAVELARILGASAEQAAAVMTALSEGDNRIFVREDAPNGRMIVRYPAMIEAEKRRVTYARNGRKGGKASTSARSGLLEQTVEQKPKQMSGDGIGIREDTEGGAGETQEGGVLDREIRAHFSQTARMVWSPREHADLRKIVELSSWERAKELLEIAYESGARLPCAYAGGILGRQQVEEARKPQITPVGQFTKQEKRYCPG